MSNLYDEPPNKEEMLAVMKAMSEAWKSGAEFIAQSESLYFRYAVSIMDINGAERIAPGESKTTADGRKFMMDTYRAPSGKIFRIGYEIKR